MNTKKETAGMTENIRTLSYVGVALLFSLVGYASLPRQEAVDVEKEVGTLLFPEFKDPLAASSLEIIKFDEKLGSFDDFKVAKVNGNWVIPSRENYPADAEKQLGEAATSLLDLKIDGVIPTPTEQDQVMYGVREPSKEKLKVGDEGVGMLVAVEDGRGNDLVRLIIGKPVKGMKDQRFVRKPGSSVIFVTKIAAEKLTTEFDKWIEKDLLKLNGFDVAKLTLKDYSVLVQPTGAGIQAAYDPRMEAIVEYDGTSKWKLDKFTLYGKGGKSIPAELGEQEELNDQKLNDMKMAVDDLKIISAVRKPKGLGASLTVDEKIGADREAQKSLIEMGFVPIQRNKDFEIFAANGEAHVTMKDGVEYVLRFGNIAEASAGDEQGKLNRYLFVTARLNESQIPAPTLDPEPADQPAPAEKEDQAEGDKKDGADAEKKDDKESQESDARRAARESVRKANQRKTDEYNDKRKKAQAKITELNARFADWYYVVAEDTYKKIHLSRNDIVKEGSKAKEEGFGPDAFRELEKGGVSKK